VPALELDDGSVLTENAAVLSYIADRNLGAGLAPPARSMERYRLAEWLAFINSEIHKSFSPFFSPATPDAYKDILRAHLGRRLGYVQGMLERGPFLIGQAFTVADAYLFTLMRWCDKAGLERVQWPAIQRHFQATAQRPRVLQALQAEGLPPPDRL